MSEPKHDRDRPSGPGEGAPDTQFLDLEISSVLYDEADRLCREAARELLRDAIRTRLEERLGGHLREIGRLAADALADDIETNLEIETLILDRRAARSSIGDRVREIMHAKASTRGGKGTKSKKRDR
jgi:hypothetical protein